MDTYGSYTQMVPVHIWYVPVHNMISVHEQYLCTYDTCAHMVPVVPVYI